MELYVVRHAVAAERPADGSDSPSRPLTVDGAARMQVAARGMQRLGVSPELLFSSPYARATQTAELIAGELKVAVRRSDLLAPGCDLPALAELLQPHRRAKRVMLVGHEPDFSHLIGVLCGGGKLELKKGAISRVDITAFAAASGTLIWLLPPRLLREIGAERD